MSFLSNLPSGLVKIGCRTHSSEREELAQLLEEVCTEGDARAIKIVALMNKGHSTISQNGVEEIAARLHNLGEYKFVQQFLSATQIAKIERKEKERTLAERMVDGC